MLIRSILFGASLLIAAGTAFAHADNIDAGDGSGYWKSGDNVITTGLDSCLRSGTWSADSQISACEGIEEAVPEPEPTEAVVKTEPEPEPEVEKIAKLEKATITENTEFESGSATLTNAGRQSMNSLLGKLAGYKDIAAITVTGHTDSQGSDAINQSLSEQRAQTVANVLSDKYPDVPITVVGLGESSPIADNNTVEGRQANRRVDVSIEATRVTYN